MDDNKNIYRMSIVAIDKHNKAASELLRGRIANRKFLRRMQGRQVPQRNPQGLNKPQNERG